MSTLILKRDGQVSPTLAVVGLRALANEAVVTEDGPHPPAELVSTAHASNCVVLAGHAPNVP